jgi:hypothetical protein
MHAFFERGVDDLLRRQADALVDDLHARVAGAHGDLLGAVGMAVEAGLADEQLDAPAERFDTRSTSRADRASEAAGRARGAADAGRRAVLAEDARAGVGPIRRW